MYAVIQECTFQLDAINKAPGFATTSVTAPVFNTEVASDDH